MTTISGESVGCGHPDKVCDQISDTVMDYIRTKDRHARTAVECFLTPRRLIVGGEVGTDQEINNDELRYEIHHKLDSIGLNHRARGFSCWQDDILIELTQQSQEIYRSVFKKNRIGAGDQGIVYGYACNDTDAYMPAQAALAHRIVREINTRSKEAGWEYLYPDCKTLVTLTTKGSHTIINRVLVSVHHSKHVKLETVCRYVEEIVRPLVGAGTDIIVNPAGEWTVGCADADAGLTGRKIIVDTYCGAARHGGGAFSGKDPSKVDRSGAYYARWVAKHVVAANIATRCEIQVGYGISMTEPFNVTVDTFGTGRIPDGVLQSRICSLFDFSPGNIIEQLGLLGDFSYAETACYGHFGHFGYPWEMLEDELLGDLEISQFGRWA